MTQIPSLLWYQYLAILKSDAPELVNEYIEDIAAKMELTVDYFIAEFL